MNIFLDFKKNQFKILDDCKNNAQKIFIESLKPGSFVRTKYDISYEECINIFKENSKRLHWVFFLKQDHLSKKLTHYWEVGCCTLVRDGGDVFLFINMDLDKGFEIQRKYDLIPMNTYTEIELTHYNYLQEKYANWSELDVFVARLHKIGITVKFALNYPWIYFDTINDKKVKEKYKSEHGFVVGYMPIQKDKRMKFENLTEIFKLLRKYAK